MQSSVRFLLAQFIFVSCFLLPASAEQVHLTFFSYTSSLLTNFWGRKTPIHGSMFLPKACVRHVPACPLLIHFPGYGGTLAGSRTEVVTYARIGNKYPALTMAHLFIDTNFRGGYNYFTDSENNGPWDSAFVQEFLPYVESRFHVSGATTMRFLMGHSSGAWTAAWLQVSNPSFFNGVWAVSPDPVDFKHFYNTSLLPGSRDNFYYTAKKTLRLLVRNSGVTMKHVMQKVDDNPKEGGIISSYEFAWSPKGDDDLPQRFFDRATGALREATLQAWQDFDLHAVLVQGGPNLEAQLIGKINLFCGSNDDFFYNIPTASMCAYLKANQYGGNCKIVSGRDHFSIFNPATSYPLGLQYFILSQAAARAK